MVDQSCTYQLCNRQQEKLGMVHGTTCNKSDSRVKVKHFILYNSKSEYGHSRQLMHIHNYMHVHVATELH